MCIAPLTIRVRDIEVQVPCQECWQCRSTAVDDWVGRNIAEKLTSVACHAVTLTYGRDQSYGGVSDHVRASVLTYSDVQKYLKLLRRHGFPVRYFVTGEFGSLKGRAHWHIMLYWQRSAPLKGQAITASGVDLAKKWWPGGTAWRNDAAHGGRWISSKWGPGEIPMDWNIMDEFHWDRGYSFWTEPTHQAIRYNTKYIQKGMGDDSRQGHLAMSKQPPLGAVYFERLARRYVVQGIAPQDLFYGFPDVLKEDGKPQRFHLSGRSAELFLHAYVMEWSRVHGTKPRPQSELVELFVSNGGKVVTNPDLLPQPGDDNREWRLSFAENTARPGVKPLTDEQYRQRDDAKQKASDGVFERRMIENGDWKQEQQEQPGGVLWFERDPEVRAKYEAIWQDDYDTDAARAIRDGSDAGAESD